MNWTVTNGTVVHTNQVLGWIKVSRCGQAQHSIKSPGNGTVAINNAVNGEVVSAGTELATAYNFNDIYVKRGSADTDIRDVHVGKQVDISVDSSPKTPVTGHRPSDPELRAGQFTIYPSPDTTPSNPQKVDQYVPVRSSSLTPATRPCTRPDVRRAHPQRLTQLRGPGQLRW